MKGEQNSTDSSTRALVTRASWQTLKQQKRTTRTTHFDGPRLLVHLVRDCIARETRGTERLQYSTLGMRDDHNLTQFKNLQVQLQVGKVSSTAAGLYVVLMYQTAPLPITAISV